jgi:hypothetical protein
VIELVVGVPPVSNHNPLLTVSGLLRTSKKSLALIAGKVAAEVIVTVRPVGAPNVTAALLVAPPWNKLSGSLISGIYDTISK